MMRYSVQPDPEKTSRALGRDLHIKPKQAVNICRAIRGKRLAVAKTYLEEVVAGTRAVPYGRHKRHMAHRHGKLGPGRFPRKAAAGILKILEAAEANAEYKGLDPEEMVVSHAASHRASVIPGRMPRAQGRATPWNTSTTHIEIVLQEKEEA